MRAILKTTVSFRTKDLLKRILAGFTSIQQIDGARPLFFVCLEDPECTFEAIDGIPPVIWPLVPDLDLRAELKRINTLCTQFGVAVDSMDWLPRHTGRLLRCPDLQVETLKKIPPWFWVYLARADVIELETAVEPTGNDASQSTINPKRWQPVFLNYGGQFERWRVVNAAIRELGSSASEASGEIKPVTVMAEWNKSKPVRLMLKLGIDRTTLRATSAGAVVFEGAFQPLPATADLLHRFVRSERDVKGDFRHPTWQQLDPEQRVNIAASLGDKVTTAAITRTKQYAEWCALYASAHTAMRYYCALDGLGASTGIAVVYSGEVISALSLVSDLGW
jgi:hypothetical protein